MSELHGGRDQAWLRAHGVKWTDLLDFSTNVNPFGPSPDVLDVLKDVDVAAYPDRSVRELTELLAAKNGVDSDCILIGNGASQLIWLSAQSLLTHEGSGLIVGPTFGEYDRACSAIGASLRALIAEPPLFEPDPQRLFAMINGGRPDLLFVCSPNNPTGHSLDSGTIVDLARELKPGVLVLDEAYRAFRDGDAFGPPPAENVLLLRSLTKEYALAGLRLGYALAAPELIERLRALHPPWSVSSPAQAAGLAAIRDQDYLRQTLEATAAAAAQLKRNLEELGAAIVPSPLHYFMVEVGDAPACQHALLQRGVLVRDCSSFGLPGYVRIGTRRPQENESLLQAWAKWREAEPVVVSGAQQDVP